MRPLDTAARADPTTQECLRRDLTADEQRAVGSLERLAKGWPQSLMLFSSGSQSLYVIRVADRDALMADWDGNEDKPTITPSIHAVGCWHGWCRNGRLVSC